MMLLAVARRVTVGVIVSGLLAATATASAESAAAPTPRIVVVASRLLDVRTGHYLNDAAIYIEGERIRAVGPAQAVLTSVKADAASVIDLRGATVLPGLIDCHTHLMARIPDGDGGYGLNLLTKSEAYRALEGAADARKTLRAGFTTVRDVENEGSGYADVALRDAINAGLVEGPRMLVATRGIAAVGQYQPFGIRPDLAAFPTGAQMISGVDEARRAVREQIGHGADVIKIYADWVYPTLTVDEMRVIVEEAHKAGRKVAAHATTAEGIRNAAIAGVDSVEHGHGADKAALQLMKSKGTYLVPTLSVIDTSMEKHFGTSPYSARALAFLDSLKQTMAMAREMGVKIADGSDPSDSDGHGRNAQELEAMTKRGLTPLEAIRSATVSAADLIGWPDKVGAIEAGYYADIVAVQGDVTTDITTLQRIVFVMKGGEVIVNNIAAPNAQASR